MADKKLKIELIRSTNKALDIQKKTVVALGLHKLHSTNIVPDNDAVRGMIFRVRHMVKVEEVK